ETFVRVRDEARVIYRDGRVNEAAQASFLARWPELPTAEVAARDFSAFRVQQRTLVTHLLKQGRFHLAWAPDDVHLFLHAGVTLDILKRLSIDPTSGARAIARALDDHFARTIARWNGPPEPLEIPNVHFPGNAARGEGGGMLYHRAAKEPSNERR